LEHLPELGHVCLLAAAAAAAGTLFMLLVCSMESEAFSILQLCDLNWVMKPIVQHQQSALAA
jgi:hypothetical protein